MNGANSFIGKPQKNWIAFDRAESNVTRVLTVGPTDILELPLPLRRSDRVDPAGPLDGRDPRPTLILQRVGNSAGLEARATVVNAA